MCAVHSLWHSVLATWASLVSVAMTNTMTESALEWEGCISLYSPSPSTKEGHCRNLEVGPEIETKEEHCFLLSPGSWSATFLIQPRSACLGMEPHAQRPGSSYIN